MEDIAATLDARDILLDLDAADSAALFEAVSFALAHHGLEAEAVARALAAREALGSTGIGMGVAIPHARIEETARTHAAIVRLSSPIAFGAPDGEPAALFFLLLVPASASERHLDLLADFASLALDGKLRQRLLEGRDAGEIRALILENLRPPVLQAA
jgi:PTS system nitrogen regulatory IIA component